MEMIDLQDFKSAKIAEKHRNNTAEIPQTATYIEFEEISTKHNIIPSPTTAKSLGAVETGKTPVSTSPVIVIPQSMLWLGMVNWWGVFGKQFLPLAVGIYVVVGMYATFDLVKPMIADLMVNGVKILLALALGAVVVGLGYLFYQSPRPNSIKMPKKTNLPDNQYSPGNINVTVNVQNNQL